MFVNHAVEQVILSGFGRRSMDPEMPLMNDLAQDKLAQHNTRYTIRITGVIVANVGGNEPGLEHPAVFPLALAEQLVKTFSQKGDLIGVQVGVSPGCILCPGWAVNPKK